jgi:hypothetical protein
MEGVKPVEQCYALLPSVGLQLVKLFNGSTSLVKVCGLSDTLSFLSLPEVGSHALNAQHMSEAMMVIVCEIGQANSLISMPAVQKQQSMLKKITDLKQHQRSRRHHIHGQVR